MKRPREHKETIVLNALSQKASSTSREQNISVRCENRKNKNIIDELPLTLYTARGRKKM